MGGGGGETAATMMMMSDDDFRSRRGGKFLTWARDDLSSPTLQLDSQSGVKFQVPYWVVSMMSPVSGSRENQITNGWIQINFVQHPSLLTQRFWCVVDTIHQHSTRLLTVLHTSYRVGLRTIELVADPAISNGRVLVIVE